MAAAPKLRDGLNPAQAGAQGSPFALTAGAVCYQTGWWQKAGDTQALQGVGNIVCHHAFPVSAA